METDSGPRSGAILELHLKDLVAIAAAYLPFLQRGGLFIPTANAYQLGDAVLLRVAFPGEALQGPISGKVAWITPIHAVAGRTAGVGLHFAADDACQMLNKKIQGLVAGMTTAGLMLAG